MDDEPDIVKILREEEKLGILQSKIQSTYEKLETIDKSLDETSNQTSNMIENIKILTMEDIKLKNVEKYRTIFNNYTEAITLVDNKDCIVSWNKYTEELLNMNQNELYLKPVNSLYPAEEWRKIREENIRQKGIKYRMETKMIRKNYGLLNVELSLYVLRGKEGKIVGSIGIIRDINKFKKIERKLIKSAERYRMIFENSAVAIILANENEQIIFCNKFTEDLLDKEKKDLYLKSIESLFPVEEWQKIRSQNIMQNDKQHHHLKTKMFTKCNHIIEVDLSLSILKNHEGKVIGSISVVKDISELKQIERALEESEQKFKQLYEYAPVPYHTLSPGGIITDVNKKWCEIFGYSKKEVIGKPIFDFITCEEIETARSSFKKKIQKKKSYTGGHERTFVTKDGGKRTFMINDFLFYDNDYKILAIQTIMEDITIRLKMEKQIKESNQLLKLATKELEGKIKDRTEQVEELLKQKDELISRLGHDLKTPITILMNIIPLIEDEIDNPKAKNDCNTAIRNLIYIKNLVKEILKIAELTSPSMLLEKKEILLNKLINEVLDDNKIIFHVKNITIKNFVNKPIIVNVDEMNIKELLFNLINNAVKFTPENGEIILKTSENKETVTISITDNGIGMNKEQLRYIFNDFYKADISRHNLDGNGLGLSICKRIVEKHSGKIWAESEGEQKGSTFNFKLPKK